mmetsp:Transcript_97430/g.275574  ORF Transcript_97430/g.275574 Transcript_97430/m.275574 type:complete len:834 (+) Transcript_97430:118-2619(+)
MLRFFLVSACGFVAGEVPTLMVKIASDATSYYRVDVPPGAVALRLKAEAMRPVAMMAASGYFPSEAHFDFSNFPDWATGKTRSILRVPVDALSGSPCDACGQEGFVGECVAQAAKGPGLRCTSSPAAVAIARPKAGVGGGVVADVARPEGAIRFSDKGHSQSAGPICSKYVDACRAGSCESHRGPTYCNSTGALSGEGDCLCQRGFCEANGRCVAGELLDPGCMKVTGQTCPHYACDPKLGPTDCEDGLCVCQPGHCSVNGVCQPGTLCNEFDARGGCNMNFGAEGAVADIARRLDSAGGGRARDQDCCRRLETSRSVESGTFARCVARHFFGLDAALERGIPLPPRLGPKAVAGSRGDDEVRDGPQLVIALRASEHPGWNETGASAPDDSAEVSIRLSLAVDMTASEDESVLSDRANAGASAVAAAPIAHVERFHTMQELLTSPPFVQQLEAPLLRPGEGPDAPVHEAPRGALPLQLRRGEPLVLRLSEDAFGALPESGGALRLHVVGLAAGSRVLYSRSWPEPRSLMDLGHASLVASLPNSSVWRPSQLNTRHFAIVPAKDGHADVFFAVHTLKEAVSLDTEVGDRKMWHILAAMAIIMWLIVLALGQRNLCSCWKRNDGWSKLYERVSTTEEAAFLCVDPPAGWSSDDELPQFGTPRKSGAVAPIFGPLAAFGASVKEQLTSRLPSVSTRAGTSYRGGTSRSAIDSDSDGDGVALFRGAFGGDRKSQAHHTVEEARGLLGAAEDDEKQDFARAASPPRTPPRGRRSAGRSATGNGGHLPIDADNVSDQAAMAALMKLRPAAHDSVGDCADDDGLSASPLVGSERATFLSR